MTTYIATFSTGQIKRNSKRAYTHAWALIDDSTGRIIEKGFQNGTRHPSPASYGGAPKWQGPKARKDWDTCVNDLKSKTHIEIVEVTS